MNRILKLNQLTILFLMTCYKDLLYIIEIYYLLKILLNEDYIGIFTKMLCLYVENNEIKTF